MAEQKTLPTRAEPAQFVATIDDAQKRADTSALIDLMGEVTGERPVMWGPTIVGFGQYHYRYASGHQGDTFMLGFSPRKQALTLYLPGHLEPHCALLDQLGKHSTGKGCLYLKRLSDADPKILRRLLEAALSWHREYMASVVSASH